MVRGVRGRFNSSITRVRPFFSALLSKDASGASWLPELLATVPPGAAVPEEVRRDPGELLPALSEPRPYRDRILGKTVALPRLFEHSAPPSRAFLRWLIDNPDRLDWPERRPGVRFGYGDETQRLRTALVDGEPDERAAAQRHAHAELDRCGPEGSRRKWWAFEGHTEVDCWLETDRLLLFVEGKRTEPLSASTHWYPARNQLVRNLEVVGELAQGRAAAVLLVSERAVPELTASDLAASTPHLDAGARAQLQERYLGQITWAALCERLDIDFAALPETLADVLADEGDR
jgi:hypothetical protein